LNEFKARPNLLFEAHSNTMTSTLQDKAQQEAGLAPSSTSDAAKEEVDARSVYVGNVDYGCTPEELQAHFQECGTVNRVTILTDRGGNPKGFAYVEFLEVDAVEAACLLEGSELRGRQLKVQPKRTNVPGLKARGRGRGRGRMPFMMMPPMMAPPFMYGFGYGYVPRGRGRGRGRGGGYYGPY
jgi:polyadenylate-binding protein 2